MWTRQRIKQTTYYKNATKLNGKLLQAIKQATNWYQALAIEVFHRQLLRLQRFTIQPATGYSPPPPFLSVFKPERYNVRGADSDQAR